MSALEPFSAKDISVAGPAFAFAKKCEATLTAIVSDVEPQFRKLFKSRTSFTGGHFSPTYESAYVLTRKFRRGGVKHILIYIEPDEGDLYFGVSVRVLKTDLKKLNQHLGWGEGAGHVWSAHRVRADAERHAFTKRIMKDLRRLRTSLNRTY